MNDIDESGIGALIADAIKLTATDAAIMEFGSGEAWTREIYQSVFGAYIDGLNGKVYEKPARLQCRRSWLHQ